VQGVQEWKMCQNLTKIERVRRRRQTQRLFPLLLRSQACRVEVAELLHERVSVAINVERIQVRFCACFGETRLSHEAALGRLDSSPPTRYFWDTVLTLSSL